MVGYGLLKSYLDTLPIKKVKTENGDLYFYLRDQLVFMVFKEITFGDNRPNEVTYRLRVTNGLIDEITPIFSGDFYTSDIIKWVKEDFLKRNLNK